MPEWVRIGSVSDMPVEGRSKECLAGGIPLCLARIQGRLAALNNECPHHGAPLSEGSIEGDRIVCPWHGWSFDPESGEELHNPLGGVAVYPIRVEGEDVLCEV